MVSTKNTELVYNFWVDDKVSEQGDVRVRQPSDPVRVSTVPSYSLVTTDIVNPKFVHSLGNGKSYNVLKIEKTLFADLLAQRVSSVNWVTTYWHLVRSASREWADLEDGWDDDDAPALSTDQIEALEAFTAVAEQCHLPEPSPYIAPDGEAGFHWKASRRSSVSFLADGRFIGFCPTVDGIGVRFSGPLRFADKCEALFRAISELE